MSALGWIGNRYSASGQGAHESTLRWWRAMQRWIRGRSRPVPRGGLQATHKEDVAAFPAALARFEAGAAGELNPPAT